MSAISTPPIRELDGGRLSRLLRAGIQRLLADRAHLNKINVFPVADGDTGTNMALTMNAVLGRLRQRPDSHAGKTLTQVADAALDGARGNSGAILAQFLLGVGDSAASLATLSTAEFAAAINAGAGYAREALTQPREGTVLTVIADFARETAHLVKTHGIEDFLALFSQALLAVRKSLRGTSEQLDECRKAGVVDAGAQGFADLIEGMTEQLHRGVDVEPSDTVVSIVDAPEIAAGEVQDLSQRYCTECTISSDAIDRRKLREELASLGSSLVLAGTPRKAKVHIHVNDPEALFRVARQFGEVTAQKADDMQRQQRTAHATRRKVAIVTDSVADIPEEALERLDIHVVPLRVHFGEQSFLDKVGLSPEEFLAELVRNPLHPTTSQPPAGDFRRQFEFLTSHAEEVISIHVAASVSGTYNAAVSAAERIERASHIHAMDSANASIGEGLLVMYAAECAARGLNAEQVIERTTAMIPRTSTFALIGSLDYAVRGGRVKPVFKSIADLLRLTPVLATHADGRIAPGGILFGRRNLLDKFARFVAKRMPRNRRYRIGIGHANAEPQAQELLARISALRSGSQCAFVMPVGSTLSVHGGPGTLVVGVQDVDAISTTGDR